MAGLSPRAFELWVMSPTPVPETSRRGDSAGFDFYEVLGIDTAATPQDIRDAYRQQALRWHPDNVAADCRKLATERFRELSTAFDVLSDATKRQLYTVAADEAHATAGTRFSYYSPGYTISLEEAWGVFMRFIVTSCAQQHDFASSPGALTLICFLRSSGAVDRPGIASAAIAVALMHGEKVLEVYKELPSQDDRGAFKNAVLALARTLVK